MSLPIVVAITGASGAPYATRLLQTLLDHGREVHLTVSPSGKTVLEHELQLSLDLEQIDAATLKLDLAADSAPLHYHRHDNFFAPIASGSFLTAGMVICPCSGGTLSAIATGASDNLVQRAADVHLKERRPLVLVPRETPLSLIHLDNMRRAAEIGAIVMPASPGWYHGVRSVQDLIDFLVARILDQLKIEHSLMRRWGQ
jgi:4-hydroxy-3-polyprenylbenzoate decarboxylase